MFILETSDRMRINYSKRSLMNCLCLLLLVFSCKEEKEEIVVYGKYVVLHDGRKLSYHEYGKSEGTPVFYFHGFPSSAREVMLNSGGQTAEKLDLRIIAVNRPGYGQSDFQSDRSLLDWPDDISELADSLSIDTFSVLGVSGGGPYSIACAFKIPNRIRIVGIVSGLGPHSAPGMGDGVIAPILNSPRFIRKLMLKGFKRGLENNSDKFANRMLKTLPEVDRSIFNIPGEKELMNDAIKEGLSAGPEGAMQDAAIYKSDWGFELSDVEHEVYLWHGEEDLSVRIETGKYVAEQLPNCVPKYYPGEGHFSLLFNEEEEIFGIFTGN